MGGGCPLPIHWLEGEEGSSFYQDERRGEATRKTKLPNVSKYLGQKEIQDRSSEDLSKSPTLILTEGCS